MPMTTSQHALQPDPQGFEAGFAIAFAPDESTMTCDQAHDLVERWRVHGHGLLGQEIGGLPFLGFEHTTGIEFGRGAPQMFEARDTPADDQVQDQGALQALERAQLLRHLGSHLVTTLSK